MNEDYAVENYMDDEYLVEHCEHNYCATLFASLNQCQLVDLVVETAEVSGRRKKSCGWDH